MSQPTHGTPSAIAPAHGGVSSFVLKIVAIIAMTCNHASYAFESQLPFAALCILRGVGGLTFPTMAFLLVEGYYHTHSVKRYAGRLAIFAAVAQVPFWAVLGPFEQQYTFNVLVTLLISLGILYADDHLENRNAFVAVLLAGMFVSYWCDWGIIGPLMVYLFKAAWHSRYRWLVCLVPALTNGLAAIGAMLVEGAIAYLPDALYALVACPVAGLLTTRYDGTRGPGLKWLFYVYYPAHLAALAIAVRLVAGA